MVGRRERSGIKRTDIQRASRILAMFDFLVLVMVMCAHIIVVIAATILKYTMFYILFYLYAIFQNKRT